MIDYINDYGLILSENTSIRNIILQLNQRGLGFVVLINKKGKLIGAVTDGDLRRFMLQGHRDVVKLINRHPVKISSKMPRKDAILLIRKYSLKYVFVTDDQDVYKGYATLETLNYKPKSNAVVIMVGGLGSRLGKLTENKPKPMVPINKKPILEYIIDNIIEAGFYNFYFCVNYKKEVIKQYFGDGQKMGINITYIEEEKPMGTAGAISLIKEKQSLPMIVLNGDIITTLNFSSLLEWHLSQENDITICSRLIETTIPYGVVCFEKGTMNFRGLEEKPTTRNFMNAGIYVINPDLIRLLPKTQRTDMPCFIKIVSAICKIIRVFVINNDWLDVGRPRELKKAEALIRILENKSN